MSYKPNFVDDYEDENFYIGVKLIFQCHENVPYENIMAYYFDDSNNLKSARLVTDGKNPFSRLDINKIKSHAEKINCKHIALSTNILEFKNKTLTEKNDLKLCHCEAGEAQRGNLAFKSKQNVDIISQISIEEEIELAKNLHKLFSTNGLNLFDFILYYKNDFLSFSAEKIMDKICKK